MDVEKNQKEIPTQFLNQVTSFNQPIKETPKKNAEQTHGKCNEQKSEQRENFRKQTEILNEGLKKLKELQREDTNDKEIMKNHEQDNNESHKNQSALEKPKKHQIYYEDQISHQVSSAAPEVTTIILTITIKICFYKFTSVFRRN